jgi:hypothetical protein
MSRRNLIVAAAQMECAAGARDKNLAKASRLAEEAASRGALGYPILEPLLRQPSGLEVDPQETQSKVGSGKNPVDLIFRVNDITAFGAVTDDVVACASVVQVVGTVAS